MVETFVVKGSLFNATIDGKRLLRGWYLLVTEDEHNYVIRNNWTLFPKKICPCYDVNHDISTFIYTDAMYGEANSKTVKTSFGIVIAIIFGSGIRQIFPVSWFLGASNIPVDILLALRNILFLIVMVGLFLITLDFYRNRMFLKMLQEQKIEIKRVGSARMVGNLDYTPQGRKISTMGSFPYYMTNIFLLGLITLPAIFVEYRLFVVLAMLAYWGLCFLGQTINPKDHGRTFEINLD